MDIWVVTMEYAGVNEAGGVKDVACSLSEALAKNGCSVTVFTPFFGCTSPEKIASLSKCDMPPATEKNIEYKEGFLNEIKIVLVENKIFSEKNAVYTYTLDDEKKNPAHKKGNGFEDSLFLEALFAKSVVQYGMSNRQKSPDIILCHDAATASLPAYIMKSTADSIFFKSTKCVVTIHNAGPAYHHEFSSVAQAAEITGIATDILEKSKNGERVEPFLMAYESGAAVTTVSENYAKELTDISNDKDTDGLAQIFTAKKINICGITNGIDFDKYSTSTKENSLLPYEYDAEAGELDGKYKCRDFFLAKLASKDETNISATHMKDIFRYGFLDEKKSSDTVYFAYHGRLVSQKGIDILFEAIKNILSQTDKARFVIVGQGENRLEENAAKLADDYLGKVVYFKGYNKATARLAVAICDYIVLPSKFEPCGLEDFIAQIFGTLPVAHATGGLKKIIDSFDGFLYAPNDAQTLSEKLNSLIEFKQNHVQEFHKMISDGAKYIHEKYDWQEIAAKKYLPFFESLLRK